MYFCRDKNAKYKVSYLLFYVAIFILFILKKKTAKKLHPFGNTILKKKMKMQIIES